jgi:ribosomal protein L23
MATQFKLIQTEKNYLTQVSNTYLIGFVDKNFKPNKIEVTKMLRLAGYNPLKINVLNTYKKSKRRGKAGNTITTKSFKKYYVRLKVGETIEPPEAENNK